MPVSIYHILVRILDSMSEYATCWDPKTDQLRLTALLVHLLLLLLLLLAGCRCSSPATGWRATTTPSRSRPARCRPRRQRSRPRRQRCGASALETGPRTRPCWGPGLAGAHFPKGQEDCVYPPASPCLCARYCGASRGHGRAPSSCQQNDRQVEKEPFRGVPATECYRPMLLP